MAYCSLARRNQRVFAQSLINDSAPKCYSESAIESMLHCENSSDFLLLLPSGWRCEFYSNLSYSPIFNDQVDQIKMSFYQLLLLEFSTLHCRMKAMFPARQRSKFRRNHIVNSWTASIENRPLTWSALQLLTMSVSNCARNHALQEGYEGSTLWFSC